MFRLAVIGFMWDLSTPIALPVSAWLYNSGGYVCVMATSLILFIIACIIGLFRLWNFKENKKSAEDSFWGKTDSHQQILYSYSIFI